MERDNCIVEYSVKMILDCGTDIYKMKNLKEAKKYCKQLIKKYKDCDNVYGIRVKKERVYKHEDKN